MIPKAVLSAFQPFLMSDQPQYLGESNSGFPKLKDEDLYNLINAAKFQFTQEPILLRLQGDFVIVGDLHGNLRDTDLELQYFSEVVHNISYAVFIIIYT